ncbi:MAG TPA: serine/threonine-protein kinase [Bryobacteraceae bacterium]|jgi:serine/threonine protein kinase|nr:serine/threonine-protein kinase [Bryobacteraceae bacterium]
MSYLPDRALDHLRDVAEAPDFSATRYRVEEEIGRGGMGTVYRAWDTQLERRVALKVLNAADRVNQEAILLAQLEHPGIAPIYDAGTLPDGRAYCAMRLIQGRRLDEFLRDEPALPARLRLFQKICEAVAFAHNRGVIHCDLKPQNIMVGEFGEVFVVDWGVARTEDSAPALSAGTPPYMAPEQSGAGAQTVDTRADIFALGQILRELMPDPPPRPLAAIARKASAADPRDRFSSAQQLAADVGRFLDGLPVSSYRDTMPERLARFCRQNQVLLLLLGAYLAVKLSLYFLAPALK